MNLVNELLKYFPPEPVARELVELYFIQSNLYLPILHRPTFERYWCEYLHHKNVWFATLCILMFAVASRWYEVGRKELHDWLRGDDEWKAAGWRWFFIGLDVHCVRRSFSCPASLFEIQTLAVRLHFIWSRGLSNNHYSSWFSSCAEQHVSLLVGSLFQLDCGKHRIEVPTV